MKLRTSIASEYVSVLRSKNEATSEAKRNEYVSVFFYKNSMLISVWSHVGYSSTIAR